ncbi:DUF4129 domain-containing protein [Allorhizocola rhizosphaerae]|uniref:DUF4129 domain-containing protein n=1 Tax=Allorhizocola rhizosphaerae TaxID=1872709 RepID=UPI003CCC67A0
MLRRWWPFLAVAALLAAAGATTSMAQLPLFEAKLGIGEPGKPPESGGRASLQPRPDSGSDLEVPGWLVFAVLGLILAAVVVIVAVAIASNLKLGSRFRRRAIRKPPVQAPPSSVDAEVVAALDAGLLELDEADSDPRRAVIACWVRLERAAAAAGTPRLPGDTATDLVLRLLTGHRLSGTVLTGFADVYRVARYATRHRVDEGMREQARTALWRLRSELTEMEVVHE